MQQYINVHNIYDDISSAVIMFRQFDQCVLADKIKVPREDLEIQSAVLQGGVVIMLRPQNEECTMNAAVHKCT